MTKFLSQLTCSRDNTINLTIRVVAAYRSIVDFVLPALAGCLNRVKTPTVITNMQYWAQVFNALSAPATRLVDLLLGFDLRLGGGSAPDDDPVLPSNIFGGVATSLHSVQLHNIRLPGGSVPAFKTVEHAFLGSDEHDNPFKLQSWLNVFPAGHSFDFQSHSFIMDPRRRT
ncbi:hypothetical protein EXIGLDRAFT_20740 [Exidia glandulosa HHB12029]|uniref:Uncharacterized protein n=1 Tax=Exidia glandulosa HHB12029 TaxID=1314781 RepID=A0A165QYJ9_EXIGL|nr:hypothetical protein EXIGLDRAFT_20740 [Exidia glandulosa HHB12029]